MPASSNSASTQSPTGQCCTSGVVDPDGQCCHGALDGFGVCDGDDSTGQQLVTLTLQWLLSLAQFYTGDLSNPTSSVRTQFNNDFSAYVSGVLNRGSGSCSVQYVNGWSWGGDRRMLAEDNATATVSVTVSLLPYGGPNNLALSTLQQLLVAQSSTSSPFVITSVDGVTAAPVCGNGVCESGERPDALNDVTGCPTDCPLSSLTCPTVDGIVCNGVGVCVPSADDATVGVCSCNSAQGYGGDDCTECASGFVSVAGVCIIQVPSNATIETFPISTTDVAPASSSSSAVVR